MQVFQYDSVESTNETAKLLIREAGVVGPACVVAREQTAGKGTRGRKWASPKDAGIYLSIIETPDCEAHTAAAFRGDDPGGRVDPTAFTLAAGVACVECLRREFGICVELKPVNDLYADGGKLGGILTEAVIERGRITGLITGIGINVRRAEREFEGAPAPPISLEELVGAKAMACLDLDSLIRAIACDVHTLNASVLSGSVERIRWAWERYRIVEASEAGRP